MPAHADPDDTSPQIEEPVLVRDVDAPERPNGFRRVIVRAALLSLFILLIAILLSLIASVNAAKQDSEASRQQLSQALDSLDAAAVDRQALLDQVAAQNALLDALTQQLIGLGVDPASIPATGTPAPAPSSGGGGGGGATSGGSGSGGGATSGGGARPTTSTGGSGDLQNSTRPPAVPTVQSVPTGGGAAPAPTQAPAPTTAAPTQAPPPPAQPCLLTNVLGSGCLIPLPLA